MTEGNCLVLGGNGFLGRYIVEALHSRDKEKVAVFDLSPSVHKDDIRYFQGDISELSDLEAAFSSWRPSCVIHTASPTTESLDASLYWRVNVDGTSNVLDICSRYHVRSLIYTSSAGVTFTGNDCIRVDESEPVPENHIDSYHRTKAIAESMVLSANVKGCLRTLVLRPGVMFGPHGHQVMSNLESLGSSVMCYMQIGDNKNWFDWTYVTNVADAHILAMDKLDEEATLSNSEKLESTVLRHESDQAASCDSDASVSGQIFFITNDEPIPFWDFLRAIWKELGLSFKPDPIVLHKSIAMSAAWINETFHWFIGATPSFTRYKVTYTCTAMTHNIGKARKLLGYNPAVSLQDGIQMTGKWWVTRNRAIV